MIIGVIRRLAIMENSMVAADRAPNCATTVKLENNRMPNPSARARLETIRGVASSSAAIRTAPA